MHFVSLIVIVSVLSMIGCGRSDQEQSNLQSFELQPVETENRFSIALGVEQDPPLIAPGPGAGEWNSQAPTIQNRVLRRALLEMLDRPEASLQWGPDAVATFSHYLENSGKPFEINLVKFLAEVPSARELYLEMFEVVLDIAGNLADGVYAIGSKETYQSHVGRQENENWYLAVAGYSAWIRGSLRIEGRGRLATWNGAFYFWDSYDWDPGVVVPISTPIGDIRVDQDRVGELHRQGLAKEFETVGHQPFRFVFPIR